VPILLGVELLRNHGRHEDYVDYKDQWGHFPFGRPNTVRPMRRPADAGRAEALVIGVYPSAWHVHWTAPKYCRHLCHHGHISALAVDVEPEVFWDGNANDFSDRVSRWKSAVGFVEGDEHGCHGHIAPDPPAANGSSGAKVIQHYLEPLGVPVERSGLTDIFPVFMVKNSPLARANAKRPREQGAAIRDEYDPIAGMMGKHESTLPDRKTRTKLPRCAVADFGDKLVYEFVETKPKLVISLGEEVWEALRIWPRITFSHPATTFGDLKGPRYGARGEIIVGGHTSEWLPLVHPGLLRLKPDRELTPDANCWEDHHLRWERQLRLGK
jgi:hypothetical protein